MAERKIRVIFVLGKLAEWSIAAVLKTVELQGSGGSNPSLSATGVKRRRLARSMPGFASRRGKPGLFVLSREAVVAEKTALRCNIFPLAVSKGKKFQIMNKLICHVGLLCGVLLVMLDATLAQSLAELRVVCGKQAVILIP